MPAELRPEAAPAAAAKSAPDIDMSLLGLVTHWQIVIAELLERGVDLYDPAVRRRPWPGIRTLIFSLYDSDSRLRRALTRR